MISIPSNKLFAVDFAVEILMKNFVKLIFVNCAKESQKLFGTPRKRNRLAECFEISPKYDKFVLGD